MADTHPPVSLLTATLSGGALWGLARIYVAAFSPNAPRKRDMAAATVETTCAIASAAIAGKYVSPAVVGLIHVTDPSTASLISVFIGLGFWQSIPALRALAARFLPEEVARVLGLKAPPESVS